MSEHFTMSDFIESKTASDKGIDNTPSIEIQRQIPFTMAGMERIRAALGKPVIVNSGFRCDALNKEVGGSTTSQHVKGEACDFVCPEFGVPKTIAIYLARNMRLLGIDQLIMEGTWVHVSFTLTPRYEILSKIEGGYAKGIV